MDKPRVKGRVIDCLPNMQYKVDLGDGKIVRSYAAGKIKLHKIRIALGDMVEIEVPEQGEIYRLVYRR